MAAAVAHVVGRDIDRRGDGFAALRRGGGFADAAAGQHRHGEGADADATKDAGVFHVRLSVGGAPKADATRSEDSTREMGARPTPSRIFHMRPGNPGFALASQGWTWASP
jgi:hypothetical protein